MLEHGVEVAMGVDDVEVHLPSLTLRPDVLLPGNCGSV